jgi:hypothetical protein
MAETLYSNNKEIIKDNIHGLLSVWVGDLIDESLGYVGMCLKQQ